MVQQRQTVLKKISVTDSQLVGKVGKREMTFLWGEVSAPGEAGKGTVSPSLQWLPLSCTRKLSAIFEEDFLSLSPPLSLCHHLPPLFPISLFVCSVYQPPRSRPSLSSFSLSATVKSDRLQVCFLCEGGFTAAVCLQPLSMTQHLSQFTVL